MRRAGTVIWIAEPRPATKREHRDAARAIDFTHDLVRIQAAGAVSFDRLVLSRAVPALCRRAPADCPAAASPPFAIVSSRMAPRQVAFRCIK
jgi:hypothetical protein